MEKYHFTKKKHVFANLISQNKFHLATGDHNAFVYNWPNWIQVMFSYEICIEKILFTLSDGEWIIILGGWNSSWKYSDGFLLRSAILTFCSLVSMFIGYQWIFFSLPKHKSQKLSKYLQWISHETTSNGIQTIIKIKSNWRYFHWNRTINTTNSI